MLFLFSDHLPPISEVIKGDTKVVTEFKRNEEGKLLKVISVSVYGSFVILCTFNCIDFFQFDRL